MADVGVSIKSRGKYLSTINALKAMRDIDVSPILYRYARMGVDFLKEATPIETGETRDSWTYKITGEPGSYRITFINNNISDGTFNIAMALEYGHATGNGGWVEGRHYINPAIEKTFNLLAEDLYSKVWR